MQTLRINTEASLLADLINFLNKNAGALTVAFTAVVTFSTVAYAILTWRLVSETKRMRQVQTEPKIEITAKPLEFAINIVRLHIRNIGLGPAITVRFSPRVVSGGEAALALLAEFTETNFFKVGLAYFGPGQELQSHYTQMTQNLDAKLASILAFDLEYRSVTGATYHDTITIDMSEQKGAYQLGRPSLYAIAQSLDRIQKDIGQIISGFRKIKADIYTATDREVEAQETKKRREQGKKYGQTS
jgi:hypothetical protein